MDCFPNAQIVATDLSLPLLKALKDYYDANYSSKTCYIVQLNAEDIIFEQETIDLIVGGAVLHHLFDPYRTIAECYKVLKPGGVAVFFEPFEIGNQIISLIFKHLVQLNEIYSVRNSLNDSGWVRKFVNRGSDTRIEIIPPHITNFFKAWCFDIKSRRENDKSNPKFQSMDDKWLFTERYFEEMRRKIGFKELVIFPLTDKFDHLFFDQISVYLTLAFGVDISILPEWAIDQIGQYDDHFSSELRQELIIEGGIVLIK
jgi:ubiquinone/menaquinone biosynthesis C-methylase UbiE